MFWRGGSHAPILSGHWECVYDERSFSYRSTESRHRGFLPDDDCGGGTIAGGSIGRRSGCRRRSFCRLSPRQKHATNPIARILSRGPPGGIPRGPIVGFGLAVPGEATKQRCGKFDRRWSRQAPSAGREWNNQGRRCRRAAPHEDDQTESQSRRKSFSLAHGPGCEVRSGEISG